MFKIRYLLFLIFFLLISLTWSSEKPVILSKDIPVISPELSAYLTEKSSEDNIKIWVFFTDKGIFEKDDFSKVQAKTLKFFTAKSLQRRARVFKEDLVTFYDIPVCSSYIERIKSLGAILRRTSRWLNAASFEISVSMVDRLLDLGFVKSIKPVHTFIRKPLRMEQQAEFRTLLPADYGASYEQLQQINVPAVHTLGYRGEGVLVLMMDTGYRKDHKAFKSAYLEGRVWTEYDFINNDTNTQNETGQDASNQHNHGTSTWSALGGEVDGELYGPAYKANFILAKTEYVPSETRVEEDNWVAGMEWGDSIGADVISSSLGYLNFDGGFTYTPEQLNGDYAVTTIAADIAASLGIVVCNAMGNEGPGVSSLITPADADTIIACGAVSSTGTIASFSSRGPTADGRIKPEVVARGVSTFCATASDTNTFGYASGTSLSTPLVGGCAAVLLSAHPEWVPWKVREALMYTANNSYTPDNIYGWGLIDLLAAVNYTFNTGDVNRDNNLGISDIVYLINYLLKGGAEPYLHYRGDTNCDQEVTISDIIYLINHLFKGGPAPCSY